VFGWVSGLGQLGVYTIRSQKSKSNPASINPCAALRLLDSPRLRSLVVLQFADLGRRLLIVR
jgi:hypothetical protein